MLTAKMEANGVTTRQLADALGIDRRDIGKMRQGRRKIPFTVNQLNSAIGTLTERDHFKFTGRELFQYVKIRTEGNLPCEVPSNELRDALHSYGRMIQMVVDEDLPITASVDELRDALHSYGRMIQMVVDGDLPSTASVDELRDALHLYDRMMQDVAS